MKIDYKSNYWLLYTQWENKRLSQIPLILPVLTELPMQHLKILLHLSYLFFFLSESWEKK